MSNLTEILESMNIIVNKLKVVPYIPVKITVFVIYGCHTIAIRSSDHQPISRIITACLNKNNLIHADYILENSIGIELKGSWPSGILKEHERLYIKPKL